MYDQPSFKAQEGPRPGPPAGSVPVTGIENIDWGTALENPVPAGRTSIDRGRELFAINCAMCHGKSGRGDGRVGAHFTPPPPNLHEQRIIALADADIFKRIALGFGRMPAFKKRITPEDRWNLVNFVRELQRPEEEKKK
jgi:mono/diheme cytochrome c family protein